MYTGMQVHLDGMGADGLDVCLGQRDDALVQTGAAGLLDGRDMRDIVGYGVMSTPGVVIDGKVVHAGGVPSRDKIEQWFAAQ